MPRKAVWTKAKAEFVVEAIHAFCGPHSRWGLKTAPAPKGTERRDRYEELCRKLATYVGSNANGVKVCVQSTFMNQWWHDPMARQWAIWAISKALEVGFITPEESPMIRFEGQPEATTGEAVAADE